MVFLSFEISFSQNNLVSNLNDYTFPHFLAVLGHFWAFFGLDCGTRFGGETFTNKIL
jgi:hypothetical protein